MTQNNHETNDSVNNNPNDDAVARTRYFIITLTRLFGAVMLILGILVINGTIGWPDIAGYALIVVGIADTFIIPQILVRRWRTPPQ